MNDNFINVIPLLSIFAQEMRNSQSFSLSLRQTLPFLVPAEKIGRKEEFNLKFKKINLMRA